MSLRHELTAYIQEQLVGGQRRTLQIDESTPLIDGGVIDSMGLMQLVMFIEERTGVRVPDDEVLPDNFQTVATIDEMVRRLQARGRGAAGAGGAP